MKGYSKEEREILTLISDFCKNECASCQDCPEDICVLWRIEQVILKYSKIDESMVKKTPSSFQEFYCEDNPECSECQLKEALDISEAIEEDEKRH